MSGPTAGGLSADEREDDGPECETCGKTTCPDADLPSFSEPRECMYAPIYQALHDARDCDYGCARDYTNQAVRLEVVAAVEAILAARLAQADEDRAAVERVTVVLTEHWDWKAGLSLHAAVRAALTPGSGDKP